MSAGPSHSSQSIQSIPSVTSLPEDEPSRADERSRSRATSQSDLVSRSRNTSQPPVSHSPVSQSTDQVIQIAAAGAVQQPSLAQPAALQLVTTHQADTSGNSSPSVGTPAPAVGKPPLPAGVSTSLQHTQPGTPSTVCILCTVCVCHRALLYQVAR